MLAFTSTNILIDSPDELGSPKNIRCSSVFFIFSVFKVFFT